MSDELYVDLLMQEWDQERHIGELPRCLRRVLTELRATSQSVLRRNARLQVVVLQEAPFSRIPHVRYCSIRNSPFPVR